MKLRTTSTVEPMKEIAYFDYLRLEMVDEGMLIKAKSPLFARWAKSFCNDEKWIMQKDHPWAGGSYWWMKDFAVFPPTGINGFVDYNEPSFFNDARPNLLFLFHTQLAEGFELVVKHPISLNSWEDYCHQVGEAIRDVYVKCLRKASFEATFSEVWDA